MARFGDSKGMFDSKYLDFDSRVFLFIHGNLVLLWRRKVE